MSKTVIEISHCLLGVGFTSIIASHLLKEKGVDSVVIGKKTDEAVFDFQLSSCYISPLPIFPVKNSFLFQALKLNECFPQQIVEISHSELKNFELSNYNITPNSLGEFILKDSSSLKAFCLSLKQWGNSMLHLPYSEVQKKIKRHYLSGNNNSRVGYYNGLTLYYHFMKQIHPQINYFSSIERIDYLNKIVYTDSIEIHYKKLISTIPIEQLFAYCTIKVNSPFKCEGSYFFYFSHVSDFKANQIIYDYDLNSDIIRAFSATDNIIVTQLPGYKNGNIGIENISQRLHELIPNLKDLKFEKELHMKMSYPIESITDMHTLENIDLLKDNSVFPFGRFGNWEYSDLHELNWGSLL